MIPSLAVGCDLCQAVENAVIALASTAYGNGWLIETIKNPTTGELKQIRLCPRCRVEVMAYLRKKEATSAG